MTEQDYSKNSLDEPLPQPGIVVIAPAWLQEAMSVLLNAVSTIHTLTITADIHTALTACHAEDPKLVLLYGREAVETTCNDIARLKAAWPQIRCIVLVDNRSQFELVKSAGADQAVIKGISPSQLMQVIQTASEEQDVGDCSCNGNHALKEH